MLKFLTKNPLTHALAWIGIYVGSVNVLDSLSESLGVLNLATSLGLLGLSLLSLLYLSRNNLTKRFGLNGIKSESYKKMLYFIPLIILGLSLVLSEQLFIDVWLITHGIASMCATNDIDLSLDEVTTILRDAFAGFKHQLLKEKETHA